MYNQDMEITHIHVFVNGEGKEFPFAELDVDRHPSTETLKRSVEYHLDLEQGTLINYEVEGYETTGQVVLRPDAKLGSEEDALLIHSHIFDSLLNSPHGNLEDTIALHQLMCEQDPIFYAHMAVWAMDNIQVRDQKEAFLAVLFASEHQELKDAAFVLMQNMPAYQVARIRRHVEGCWTPLEIRVRKDSPADEKRNAKSFFLLKAEIIKNMDDTNITSKFRDKLNTYGVNKDHQVRFRFFKGVKKDKEGVKTKVPRVKIEYFQRGIKNRAPRTLKTAVTSYLRNLEHDQKKLDRDTVRQYDALKELYARFHIKPSEYAHGVLFDKNPPKGSMRFHMKEVAKTTDPLEWAQKVVQYNIPFPVAVGLCTGKLTPVHYAALINQMSSSELLNNMGAMEARGALENPEVKDLVQKKLKKAQTHGKVDALKAQKATKEVGVKLSQDVVKDLEAVTDARVSASASIKKATLLAIDASSSMDTAIEVGKELGALIAPCCKGIFACISFNDMPREHIVKNPEKKSSWDEALKYVKAVGYTNMGSVVRYMEKSKVPWEQVVLVTDEGDNGNVKFHDALSICEGQKPNVVIVRLNSTSGGYTDLVEKGLKSKGIEVDVFDLTKNRTVDYYSLPNILPMLSKGSRMDLLMAIMDRPLPDRQKWIASHPHVK